MSIIDRYICTTFARFFAICFAALLALALVVDFFEKIRMFLSNDASLSQIVRYFFVALPMLTSFVAPAAMLIGTLVAFGSLASHNEITAMKASGTGIYRISLPMFVIAGLFSGLYFLFGELVTPQTNAMMENIIRVEIQKQEPRGTFAQNEIWYRGRAGIYNFRLFDPATNSIHGVSITQFGPDFDIIRRLDTAKAVWRDNHWFCEELLVTSFTDSRHPRIERHKGATLKIPETPADFDRVQITADKMGFFELGSYVDRLRQEGHDVTTYLTDWHGKLAFSLVNLILAAIGIAYSLKTERSGALARSVGTGIVIGLSYWIFFAAAMSFGRTGLLPPWIAAWLANAIFGLAALYLFVKIRT